MQIQKVLIKLVISKTQTLQDDHLEKRKCHSSDTQQFISIFRNAVRKSIGKRRVSRKRKMYQKSKRKGDQNVILKMFTLQRDTFFYS